MQKILMVLSLMLSTNLFSSNLDGIVYKYAPIIITKHADVSDQIVKLNYDNDFDLTNNHEKAPDNSKGVEIYYTATETTNFAVISYMIYHEREIPKTGIGNHTHDSESIVVFVEKNTSEVLFFSTNSHGVALNSLGNSQNVNRISGLPEIDTNAEHFAAFEMFDGSAYVDHHKNATVDKYLVNNHPVVFVAPGSHAIYRSSIDNLDTSKFNIYIPALEADFLNSDVRKASNEYLLVSLAETIYINGLQNTKDVLKIKESEDLNNIDIFKKYFKPNFFSPQKGQIKWTKADGSIGILPSHFAQPTSEKEPESDLPINFKNKGFLFVINPETLLDGIGFKSEKVLGSTFDILPSLVKNGADPTKPDKPNKPEHREDVAKPENNKEPVIADPKANAEFLKIWEVMQSKHIGTVNGNVKAVTNKLESALSN